LFRKYVLGNRTMISSAYRWWYVYLFIGNIIDVRTSSVASVMRIWSVLCAHKYICIYTQTVVVRNRSASACHPYTDIPSSGSGLRPPVHHHRRIIIIIITIARRRISRSDTHRGGLHTAGHAFVYCTHV